jgi:hypothetical protein
MVTALKHQVLKGSPQRSQILHFCSGEACLLMMYLFYPRASVESNNLLSDYADMAKAFQDYIAVLL